MSNNRYRRSNNYDNDRPEGWFDPQDYAENREKYNDYNSRRNSGYRNEDRDMNAQRSGRYNDSAYTKGHDPHSGFPRYSDGYYRFNENNRYNDNSDGRSHRDNSYNNPRNSLMYGDNFEQPSRYRNEGMDRNGRNNSYGSGNDGRNWYNDNEMWNRDYGRYRDRDRNYERDGNYGNRDYNERDRDWWDRTTDEVASWFGDEEAERRRKMDKREGPHHGKGPKGYERSDEKMKDEINEKLYHDSFLDAGEIEVEVKNCNAILSGTVETRYAKRRAEDLAERISGIKDVENRLKVSNRTEDTNKDMDNNKSVRSTTYKNTKATSNNN